ncbi:hypothetical protein [Demequina oxidasica]|uniref:hypothetical protein n=1 Tax=Demequina oxidasica TaxID=676199 RepID=UPI0007839CEA|nr:hypothetical protein [Demequina oxidasica]
MTATPQPFIASTSFGQSADGFGWLNANAEALQAIGSIAALLAAVIAILALVRAGLDSAARTRPYVVVEYRVPEQGMSRLDLVVRNVGPTAARDISLKFRPSLASDNPERRLANLAAGRFEDTVSVMGPGQELFSVLQVDDKDDTKSDVGPVLTVDVSYRSPWWRIGSYTDRFELQRSVYTGHVFTRSSDSVLGRLSKIAKDLGKIEANQKGATNATLMLASAVEMGFNRVASPCAGVQWGHQRVGQNIHRVENIGDAVAENVTLTVDPTMFRDGDPFDGAQTVHPGQRLEFVAEASLATADSTVLVSWTEGSGSEVEEWRFKA